VAGAGFDDGDELTSVPLPFPSSPLPFIPALPSNPPLSSPALPSLERDSGI